MKKRPKPNYIKVHRKEEPESFIRQKLIDRYNSGGCDIEPENTVDIGHCNKITCLSELRSRELSYWLYVGDLWWCRYIKRKKLYEFARYVAYLNDDKCDKVVGLWRESRYGFREPLVIVERDDLKGHITGHSEFEVWVKWDNGKVEAVRDLENIRFEFIEDEEYYSRIISNIKR